MALAEHEYPNFGGKALANRERLKQVERNMHENMGKEDIASGVECQWCKEEIKNLMFTCKFHRQSFCEGCIKQRGEFTRFTFVKCKVPRGQERDCIWERIDL